MGTFLKVVLGIAVVGGGLFYFVFQMTAGMVDTADGFFRAVRQQDVVKARSFLATETNRKLDDRTLRKLMQTDALAQYQAASFPNRRISGNQGEISGTITTRSGGVVPVHVVLVQEGENWKLYSFKTQ